MSISSFRVVTLWSFHAIHFWPTGNASSKRSSIDLLIHCTSIVSDLNASGNKNLNPIFKKTKFNLDPSKQYRPPSINGGVFNCISVMVIRKYPDANTDAEYLASKQYPIKSGIWPDAIWMQPGCKTAFAFTMILVSGCNVIFSYRLFLLVYFRAPMNTGVWSGCKTGCKK